MQSNSPPSSSNWPTWPKICGLAALAATMALGVSGTAFAQVIQNPPLLPQEVTVFPERDFMSVSGFAPNAEVLVQLMRGGVMVSDAIGKTDATGFVEVNHPGGVCWRNVTPDMVPADVVRVTYRDTSSNRKLVPAPVAGSGAATTTQNVAVTQAVDAGNGTVVVTGKAQQTNGTRIPLNRLEVRIINPGFMDPPRSRIGKRDIRADSTGGRIDGANGGPIPGTSGFLAYDAPAGNNSLPVTFTAVFQGLTAAERQLVLEGQTRVMGWQQTAAAGERLGMTIYEAGQSGGPGISSCPPGPNGAVPPKNPTAPVAYRPADLLDAAKPVNQPSLKGVTVFPERDFISVDGFAEGTDLQIVVRRGNSAAPVVGTARGIVGSGGLFEVNHPGGVCWTGQTPDISPGDWIDVFKVVDMGFSAGQTQRVMDTRITQTAFITAAGEVRIHGSALGADGLPLPMRLMEQRIINPDFNTTRIGRHDIRADSNGGRVENVPGGTGNMLRTGTGSDWSVVYSGLNATERQMALAGQNRVLAWLSTNGNGDRFGMTIFEAGEPGGPGFGGCPAKGNASIAITP